MYAKGIKRKDFPGDESRLRPGMLVDYFIQQHFAKRRGPHYDFRIGDKNTNLFSWATNEHPTKIHEGDRKPAARTNLHQHSYGKWEGMIPKGYGHGLVKSDTIGKALITRNTGKTISFSTANEKYPARYTLVNPGEKYGKGYWMMLRQKMPEATGIEKTHYKTVDNPEEHIKSLTDKEIVQPKLDGALQYLLLHKNKVEMLSHRLSDVNNKPITHTERFFGQRPHIKIPRELSKAIILAEVYGAKDGKPIPQQETSALLNSSLDKSLTDQKDRNIKLQAMLFDVARYKGKNIKFDIPYSERRKILEKVVDVLKSKQFHLPDEHKGSEAKKVWDDIKDNKHHQTNEGLIVYPEKGVPTKLKHMPEQDVYIRKFFEGDGKYKGKGVGGFEYSHTPDGPVVGKVGTGLNDKLRELMHKDPKGFINRIARVHSQGQLPSGALRAPALINLHEG